MGKPTGFMEHPRELPPDPRPRRVDGPPGPVENFAARETLQTVVEHVVRDELVWRDRETVDPEDDAAGRHAEQVRRRRGESPRGAAAAYPDRPPPDRPAASPAATSSVAAVNA